MKRAVKSLEAFPFSSRFDAPDPDPDRISMSLQELSSLIADTREQTAKLVRDEQARTSARELDRISERLGAALRAIVSLAEVLERAAIDEADRARALDSVRHLAKSLIDGQGELFDTRSHIHTSERISEHSDPNASGEAV